jgi:hypothetical protein
VFLYRDLICQVIIIGVWLELKFAIRYFIALVEHGNIQNLKIKYEYLVVATGLQLRFDKVSKLNT